MKKYSIIFSISNASVTLVAEDRTSRVFIPFDDVHQLLSHLKERLILVPRSQVFTGYEQWKAANA